MNQWPDILFKVYAVCAPWVCYRLGKMATRGEIERQRERSDAALVSVAMQDAQKRRELRERDALIEQMKRAGRKRREEVKNLKKALKTKKAIAESGDDLLLLVARALAESNAEMIIENTELRDALHEIAGECAKSRWQMKVFRRILKKHGVKCNV